jgi:hypothetical protein
MKKQYIVDVTAAQVAAVLSYDPLTGLFTHLVAAHCREQGSLAGRVDSKGYYRIRLFGYELKSHRLAWLLTHGAWPTQEIDHINGIPGDNRLCNLREATVSENGQNRKRAMRNNITGMLGVSSVAGKYVAQLKVQGVRHHLGVFNTAEEAHAAYLAAKEQLHPFWTA